MNQFIEQNRGLLRTYCVAARIIGWVLLTVPGIVAVIVVLRGPLPSANKLYNILYMVQAVVLNFMLLGLVALGIAQFIRYLFENQYQPGWILRNGTTILYACAVLVLAGSVVQYSFHVTVMGSASNFSLLLILLPVVLPAVAKGLILIGLAQVLRRIMPIIEESKTLV